MTSSFTKDSLEQNFIESGEKARLTELIKLRLAETGWSKDVEVKCRDIIKNKGIENISLEELISEATPYARKTVPDSVKRELMSMIRSFLQQQTGLTDL